MASVRASENHFMEATSTARDQVSIQVPDNINITTATSSSSMSDLSSETHMQRLLTETDPTYQSTASGEGSQSQRLSRSSSLQRLASPNNDATAVRMNVLNNGLNPQRASARTNKCIMYFSTAVALPQIVAGIIILATHYSSTPDTPEACRRLKEWVLGQTVVLTVSLICEWLVYGCELPIESSWFSVSFRERFTQQIQNAKYCIDIAVLVWFLVGNMYVFNDESSCEAPEGHAMHSMALVMIIVAYVKIFLPCVIVLTLIPIICFCLPCLIRALRYYGGYDFLIRGKGTTQDVIDKLGVEKFSLDTFPSDKDASCCICMNDYEDGQEMRKLPCGHHYHKECVDEWLLMNATCPTCRLSITGTSEERGDSSEVRGDAAV